MPSSLTAARLRGALATHVRADFGPLPGRTNHLQAGVLVPVVLGPQPQVVLTLRAPRMRQHAGEVSFPGGKPDPTDASLRHTAEREAREELQLDTVEVLGRLSTVPVFTSDFKLTPYLGVIDAVPGIGSPQEVAQVLRLPILGVLLAAHVDAIAFELDGKSWLSPVFHADGHRVFGATAHVLWEALNVIAPLLDTQPPPLRTGRYTWQTVRPTAAPR